MIAATELRIGNWIMYGKKYFKVVAGNTIDYIISKGDDFQPIPLTPEILKKAKFDITIGSETSNYKYWCSNGFVDVRFKEDGFTFYYATGGSRRIMDHIKSVHQLQNLFYDLTGTELTIQL